MKNKLFFILAWAFLILCIVIGGFLGIYINGKATGEFNFDFAVPILAGTFSGVVLSLVFYKWRKKRNRNVPDFDERSLLLMKRYFMIVLYVILIGSGAILLALYSMGVQTIETGLLIVCLAFLYLFIGIGALLTKYF